MSDSVVLYGTHAITTLLSRSPQCIKSLHVGNVSAEMMAEIDVARQRHALTVIGADARSLAALVGGGVVHQGIVALCSPPAVLGEADVLPLLEQQTAPILLILDQVQDPHNLGACLRTANAMGACAVMVPQDNAVGLTPVVHKVACGASVVTPLIQVPNLVRVMKSIQAAGVWLVGMAAEASINLDAVDLTGAIGIVMGGEAKGLRSLTRKNCDYLARLPMQGTVESLNVSVSTGMALYEAYRQRR